MNHSTPTTPRRAAYRELCSIIAQLSGRSRRAQRALLEAELVRALERAYDFQRRCAELGALAAGQRAKLLAADIDVALAQGAARQRAQGMRQEVFAAVERCRAFERTCREFLVMTDDAVTPEPAPLVAAPSAVAAPPAADDDTAIPVDGVDEEAVTERCPRSSVPPKAEES